ncbi:poly(A)-specific ribonuclease [Malassezia yamatoensis]|uniref:Poly(A)-specific ribonuclease n=1 Tax=Malassezia yamatoensis TaxID=253288 RepID=A0AAJ6CI06_9BASI|nr:poly(A)-specific ribonuclease [Malassezia yamatoensis]
MLGECLGWLIGSDHAPGLELAAMCASPSTTSSEIFVGGSTNEAVNGNLTESDVLLAIHKNNGKVLRQVAAEAPITHLLKSGRYVCCGTAQGNIQLRDPRTLAIEHQIVAHHGGLIDLQTDGNSIYSIGWTLRQGHRVPEPLIKVHDLRTFQARVPIPMTAPGGPGFLAIHPKRSSLLAVATPQAQFQIVDTTQPGQTQFYSLASTSYVCCMAYSSSAEAIVFGESDGSVRIWTNSANGTQNAMPVRFNAYPTKAMPMPDYALAPTQIKWQPDTPLSCIGMPYYDQPLLSAFSSDEYWSHGTPLLTRPAMLDHTLNRAASRPSTNGYISVPKHLRGQRNQLVSTDDLTARFDRNGKLKRTALAQLRGARGDRRVHLARFHSEQSGTVAPAEDTWDSDTGGLPGYYRLLSIQYSKFGVEDFDFGYYNKTPFAGLEAPTLGSGASYVNAYLQALQYTHPVRAFAIRHILMPCPNDQCLLCEAGFLFRMLEDANGCHCQSTTFARVFSNLPKVRSLGLLDDEKEARVPPEPYSQLVQQLNHFLLSDMSQNALQTGASIKLSKNMLALCANPCAYTLQTHSACGLCGHRSSRQQLAHVLSLAYPPPGSPAASRLADLLPMSFSRDSVARGKCRHCQAPHAPHTTFRTIQSTDALPAVLSMNAGVMTASQLAQWSSKRDDNHHDFLTPFLCLKVNQGRVSASAHTSRPEEEKDSAIYTLRSLVVQVQGAHDAPHLCTIVRGASAEQPDTWTLFNDFLVRPVPADEVLHFGESWKIPALLTWERIDSTAMERTKHLSHVAKHLKPDWSLLSTDENIAIHRDPKRIRHQPLDPDEVLERDTLVAIDTEFIALAEEEAEVCSDGTRTVLKPGCLALARVSVIRGQGPREGVPFIDDHIYVEEPIVDHLTQFSGIQPGDLDPSTSKATLVTHKTAYKKLRLLVDRGCRFIGHGLAKDFRIINLYVPPSQVIDTVSLYHSPAHPRNLSLRFLAWFLLQRDIQSGLVFKSNEANDHDELHEGHDSIEDAEAALQLYRCYEQIVLEDRLEDMLEDLYEIGARVHWRPPQRKSES